MMYSKWIQIDPSAFISNSLCQLLSPMLCHFTLVHSNKLWSIATEWRLFTRHCVPCCVQSYRHNMFMLTDQNVEVTVTGARWWSCGRFEAGQTTESYVLQNLQLTKAGNTTSIKDKYNVTIVSCRKPASAWEQASGGGVSLNLQQPSLLLAFSLISWYKWWKGKQGHSMWGKRSIACDSVASGVLISSCPWGLLWF